MSDSHWLDEDGPAEPEAVPVRPATPLGAVAARLGDVAPSWASVTGDPLDAPRSTPAIELLGRQRAQGVEAIREGWLLHRGGSRIVGEASEDLSLLMGDWCYAAGLCQITDEGTLDDVAELARLVADVSVRVNEPVEALEARWDEATEAMRA